jgi:hypothetical protein
MLHHAAWAEQMTLTSLLWAMAAVLAIKPEADKATASWVTRLSCNFFMMKLSKLSGEMMRKFNKDGKRENPHLNQFGLADYQDAC